jgi:hypothetical protein
MERKEQLKKLHPRWNNSTLLKEAWKPYKKKASVSGTRTKKKAAKKRRVGSTAPKKRAAQWKRVGPAPRKSRVSGVSRPVRKKVSGGLGSVSITAREQKRIIEGALGEFMARQFLAKTKTEKRKIGKKIAELKRKLAAIGKLTKN